MGAVYEAIEEATQEWRAVKVLMTTPTSDDRTMRLFLREANILSQLDHPRIVRFHEIGWSEGRIFIVMEYVPQVDLKSLLKQRPVVQRVRVVCGLVAQVLDALAFAHGRGLVHRDVKPSNILVSKQAKKLSAKLADFGLAKSFETAGFSAMTADGEARGTLGYMCPSSCATAAASSRVPTFTRSGSRSFTCSRTGIRSNPHIRRSPCCRRSKHHRSRWKRFFRKPPGAV